MSAWSFTGKLGASGYVGLPAPEEGRSINRRAICLAGQRAQQANHRGARRVLTAGAHQRITTRAYCPGPTWHTGRAFLPPGRPERLPHERPPAGQHPGPAAPRAARCS